MAEEAVNDRKPIRDTVEALITVSVAILLGYVLVYFSVQSDKWDISENAARIEASCQTPGMTRLKSSGSALCVDAKGQVFVPPDVVK
jgi:hypothetical protein